MRIIQVLFVLVVLSYEIKGESRRRGIRSSCFCSENECCSKWGYCGKTDAYCGKDCRSGPCKTRSHGKHTGSHITSEVFACIFPTIDTDLRAQQFTGLIEAMEQMKWKPLNSVEAAIFLSHVSRETDGLKTLVEYCAKQGTCNNYQTSWCSIEALPNKKYYGRGWFQLSYPCNYYNAGKALSLNLLDNPDLVSENDKIAASTAIWYFKETNMDQLAQNGDFGGTTRKISEYECSGKGGYRLQTARVETYHKVRQCFGLPEATINLTC